MDQCGGNTPRIECPRPRTLFQEHTPPGTAVHLHLLKFAFLLAPLRCGFSLALLSRAQALNHAEAKCNIRQLQKSVAFRRLRPAKLPIALEPGTFEGIGWSDPQVIFAISLLGVLGFLALLN